MSKPIPRAIRSIRGLFFVAAFSALALFLSPLLYAERLFTSVTMNVGLAYTFLGGVVSAMLVMRGHPLARHVSWTVLPLLLLFFPLGTLVGGMIIAAMRNAEARDYLNGLWEPPTGWRADLAWRRHRREVLGIVFAVPLGLLGAVGAFYATWFVCKLGSDKLGSEGLVQVGWLFCFFTIPLGIFLGAMLGMTLANVGCFEADPSDVSDPSH